jgi:hypothetical protein
MTDKEAMKLALEALEANGHDWHIKERKAKEALRQAIEDAENQKQEQGEPVAIVCNKGPKFHHVAILTDSGKQLEDGAKLYTTPQVKQEQGEPVAWQCRTRPQWGSHLWTVWAECKKEVAEDYLKTPVSHEWEYEVRVLYTTPYVPEGRQQRPSLRDIKPLTDEQMTEIYLQNHAAWQEFARAIEAAHSITSVPDFKE